MTIIVKTILFDLPDINDEHRKSMMLSRLEEAKSKYFSMVIDQELEADESDSELSHDLIHILKDYATFPYEPVSIKAQSLGYSIPTMTRYLTGLIEKGFVVEERVNLGKSSGVVRLYKFTEKSIKEIGKQALVGRGSMQHGFWLYTIKSIFENKGYNVVLEYYVDETRASLDVGVFMNNDEKFLAVQVELNNNYDHSVQNVVKCQKAGFPRVIVGSQSEYLLKGIRNVALNKEISIANVEFKLLRRFYDECYRRNQGRQAS